MTTIYLIRHAEAEGNLYRRIHGWYDALVTDNGFRQIEALAKRFADIPVDAVYASGLYRTNTTARAVYAPKKLPLRIDPGLREIHMGDWEDRPWGEVYHFEPAEMARFNASDPTWRAPNGEGYGDVGERTVEALTRIARAHPGQTVAVFSHGTAIRQALAVVKGVPPEDWNSMGHNDNTAVSCLTWDGEKFTAVFEGDNSHLDPSISTLARQRWWRRDGKQSTDVNLWYRPAQDGAGEGLLRYEAMLGDEPTGTLELDPARGREQGVGYIARGAILPQRRGNGLGVQLIGQAVSYFRPLGRDRLRLCAPPDGGATARFLEKDGFTRAGEEDGRTVWEKYIGYDR